MQNLQFQTIFWWIVFMTTQRLIQCHSRKHYCHVLYKKGHRHSSYVCAYWVVYHFDQGCQTVSSNHNNLCSECWWYIYLLFHNLQFIKIYLDDETILFSHTTVIQNIMQDQTIKFKTDALIKQLRSVCTKQLRPDFRPGLSSG